MGYKYFFKGQSSLQRKVLVSGLMAVFCLSEGTFSGYTEAVEERDMSDRCAACLGDVLTGCRENLKNLIESHKVFVITFSICFMLAFVCCGFPYIIWNIFHETQESKNSKKENSQEAEDHKGSPEDETQFLKNKQDALLIASRIVLRVGMVATGAIAAMALTKKFSEISKSIDSSENEKCEEIKKSEPVDDNKAKFTALPQSEVVDVSENGQAEQKIKDKK